MTINSPRLFLSILLVLASAAPAQAEVPKRFAYLTLDLNARGDASFDLLINFDPHLAPGLVNSLGQSLGCSPQNTEWENDEERSELFASCDRALQRRGLVLQGGISAAPIIDALRNADVTGLTVEIDLPDAALGECGSAKGDSPGVESDSECNLHFSLPESKGTQIDISYGYRLSDVARILAPLSIFALLSIALSLWARRGALQRAQTDRVAAWFGFARFLQWMMLGNYLIWWTLADAFHLNDFVRFALDRVGFTPAQWASAPFDFLIRLFPAACLTIIAASISQPVLAQVRGSEWTVREVTIQAMWGQALIFLPAVFLLSGMGSLVNSADQRPAVVWLFIAFFSYVLIAKKVAKVRNYIPYALTTGELRDRTFALAGMAGVKLQQVYVLPTMKTRVANAFARTGNSVMLTDYLLQHLSKREVDAVIAHEVTHLQRRHPRILGIAFLVACGSAGILAAMLEDRLRPGVPLFPATILLALIIVYAVSRHFERSADAGSAKLTGDPQAAITALVKLSNLNLIPIQWGKLNERFITHPSTMRRIHRIGKLNGITAAHMEEVIRTPDNAPDHYAVPGTALVGPERIFSGAFKRSRSFRISWLIIGATTLPSALCASLAKLEHWNGAALWAAYSIGVLLTIAVVAGALNFLPVLGNGTLLRGVKAKLEVEGIRVEALGGVFVGFAPGATPRLYEKDYSWDMGFLMLDSDHLVYVGEELRFQLPLAQLNSIRLGVGPPTWWRCPTLCITWSDSEHGTGGTFNLTPADAVSLRRLRRGALALGERLQAWQESRLQLQPLPPLLIHLQSPNIGEVTSTSPRRAASPRSLIQRIVFLLIIAAGVSILLGLRFAIHPSSRIPGAANGEGQGWYVVLVTLVVAVFQVLPYARYREPFD
jgi:Zn-dependent protease with chaperone function